MKQKLFTFFLLVFILLNGCSKPESPKNEITFWHFWSEPTQRKVLNELIKEFEKEHNCTVKTTELSWSDGKTKLLAAFNSQTAPDIVELGSDWIAQFSSSGVLYPFPEKEIDLQNYIDITHEPAKYKQNVYAIPWIVDTRVLFVNKTLLSNVKIPIENIKSWDDVLDASRKIQELQLEGVYGFGANGSDPHRLYKRLLPFFWSYNGTIFDNNGQINIFTKENNQALSMYVALSREGIIETQRHLDGLFVKGKLGFWFSGSWLLPKLASTKGSFAYDVITLPSGTTEGVSFAGGEFLAMNASSQNKELGIKLISYLTNSEKTLQFCITLPEAGFPAAKKYYQDKKILEIPYKAIFAKQLQSSKMTPVEPMWLDIETILEDAAVESLLGVKPVNQALFDAQTIIQELLSYKTL